MCTSPIKIKNKSKTFIPGIDKSYFVVPCGKCPECQKRRSNDLFVRSFFEYENTKRLGGFSQLFTLTYSDNCLPKCTSLNIPCFSRVDIKLFLKRLRQKVCRFCGASVSDLRYSLVCEYGGLRQRPHYHIEFFVNTNKISPSQFKHFVISSWKFGFVSTTSINDGVVCSLSGIAYVVKYCSKDTITSNFFASQIAYLKKQRLFNEIEVLKKSMPFNCRSIGFGNFGMDSSAPYHITLDSLRTRSVILPDYKFGARTFSLPLHYVRKMLYTSYTSCKDTPLGKKYSVSYFLNDLGKSLLKDNISSYLESTKKLYNNTFASIDSGMLSYINKRYFSVLDIRSFRLILLDLTDNFSDNFVRFSCLYAPFTYLKSEYVPFSSDVPEFDEIFDFQLSSLDLKEEFYNYLVLSGDDTSSNMLFLNDVLCNKLVSVLQDESCSRYLTALYLLELMFDYLSLNNHRSSIEFEESALFRKYVLNV